MNIHITQTPNGFIANISGTVYPLKALTMYQASIEAQAIYFAEKGEGS